MARETYTRLIDDLDGVEADETVRFGLDGKSYEIDLNAKNADRLRQALAPFIDHARRASGRTNVGRRVAATGRQRNFEPAAVREWASQSGIEVSSRGRIPREIIEQYMASGGKPLRRRRRRS